MLIVVERHMDQPTQRVWATLSDVANIADWLPDIAHSSATGFAVGATRECKLSRKRLGVSALHEVFTEAGPRSLGYTVTGMPFEWHNRWQVSEGRPCVVRLETTMKLPWFFVPLRPILRRMMHKQNQGMLIALDAGAA